VGIEFMRHTFVCVSAALVTFGIATLSAAADDRETCWKAELGDEAIAACSRLISSNPGVAVYFNERGNAYVDGKHDYDRGTADYDQAIKLDPKLAVAYNGRGNVHWDKQDYDRAFSDYDQAIRLDPKLAMAYNGRGNVYWTKHDYDRAIADFDQAIGLDPRLAMAYSSRGATYLEKHDYDRAFSDFDQAIRLDSKLALAYNWRGKAHWTKHDYDRAIADLDQGIRLDPKVASVYYWRGKAYEDKRDYERSIADYEQSLKLDPKDASARQGLERVQALLSANKPGTFPIPAERRVALVIGNSGYTSSLVSALTNPRRDAKVVADALRQAGFDTVELVDLDRFGMAKALQSFRAKAASADWALVYFAGHGIEINRVNYLIPVDAKLADSGDVELETISYEAMLNAVGGAKALRIIILDACRNNPFKAQMHQTAALRGSLDRGLAAPPETEPGTLVVYSAKEGQAAVDGDGVNSPFALAFVARLKVPGREVRRMFDEVRDDVLNSTGKRQQPYTYGSLPGSRDFFFVAGGK
jgi:tetratricopeptide (TPR) repeat protein